MKQVLQSLKDGNVITAEVPAPLVKRGCLMIETRKSLISAGTERMLISFGRAGWFEKVRQQPQRVWQVLAKIQTDGLTSTLRAVSSQLNAPVSLGYANVGTVRQIGAGVEGFSVGDRVVSNGPHAEVVVVPAKFCAKIPDTVDDAVATFAVTGAIAYQGIRLLPITGGGTVAVMGLGLIGLQACQLLNALGVRVIGFDPDGSRVRLAKESGTEAYPLNEVIDPVAQAADFSNGYGVDGVLITASTKSNEPIHHAALMCRPRGKIVLVGVVGLKLNRDDFYRKEISFQVSSSYGIDRYEASLESDQTRESTVRKNFKTVLELMQRGKIHVAPLVSAEFSVEKAQEAYDRLMHDRTALGIILGYGGQAEFMRTDIALSMAPQRSYGQDAIVVGCIGAGNFSRAMLLPVLAKTGVRLKTIVSVSGVSGAIVGERHGFERAASDARIVFEDDEINAVVISTPHNSHARFVLEALRRGKHVYVEKPLCVTAEELDEIRRTYTQEGAPRGLVLTVGFNRRFAPLTKQLTVKLAQFSSPKSVVITVNAGSIPGDHWVQDPKVGGGRIISEACHFIDLARYLVGAPIEEVRAFAMRDIDQIKKLSDTVTISLRFTDGSIGTVHYFANGSKQFPKERIEVFCAGNVFCIDNFRRFLTYTKLRKRMIRQWNQDKGHAECVMEFANAIRAKKAPPIPLAEIVEVTQATFIASSFS